MANKNESITSRDVDFAQWYTDVVKKAEMMDYTSVKGFIDYLPYSYAMWERIQEYLNARFKGIGSSNVYLPTFIPSSLFNKEKEHIDGFAPETLVATIGGGEKLSDPLIMRPTSEVLFCDLYKRLVTSYRDLPKIYNPWCSVVRWEKTTRPFLRGSEFLWQEGHCLFETEEEAQKNALDVLDIYTDLGRELLAIPFVTGVKTEKEKFAGAVNTYTVEALMHDGKALQSGTTHYFGQGFAEAFGIRYLGRKNSLEVPHQTSWGVSTRLLGAVIMVHGDDNGLVLPPYIAPNQVVIVPIRQENPAVKEACAKLFKELEEEGIRVKLDDSDKTPGWKFAEYEMKGVPLRVEIGPRDLERGECVLCKRVNESKTTIALDGLAKKVPGILHEIHEEMYAKAKAHLESNVTEVHSMEELKAVLDKGGYAKAMWCGKRECEDKIKEESLGGTARCLPFDQTPHGHKCVCCGEDADKVVYFAKAY